MQAGAFNQNARAFSFSGRTQRDRTFQPRWWATIDSQSSSSLPGVSGGKQPAANRSIQPDRIANGGSAVNRPEQHGGQAADHCLARSLVDSFLHGTERHALGRELLDPGASEAFAVVDHQLAHVYVQNPARVPEVRQLLEGLDGVERVLGSDEQREVGLNHARSGELVVISRADRWFTYYYWLDPERAPDFATTVDIHRKPGYDPVELFLNPAISFPKLAIAWRLAKKLAGFRTLMDVISAERSDLVKGSHGRLTAAPEAGPLFMTDSPELLAEGPVQGVDVQELMLRHVFR